MNVISTKKFGKIVGKVSKNPKTSRCKKMRSNLTVTKANMDPQSGMTTETKDLDHTDVIDVIDISEEEVDVNFWNFAETVNGRVAMQGFVWGTLNEAITGHTIKEQLISNSPVGGLSIVPENLLAATTVIGLVMLGTAMTSILPNENMENVKSQFSGPFDESAEVMNGRLAMLGFLALVIFF